jgi:hypothetical protein
VGKVIILTTERRMAGSRQLEIRMRQMKLFSEGASREVLVKYHQKRNQVVM